MFCFQEVLEIFQIDYILYKSITKGHLYIIYALFPLKITEATRKYHKRTQQTIITQPYYTAEPNRWTGGISSQSATSSHSHASESKCSAVGLSICAYQSDTGPPPGPPAICSKELEFADEDSSALMILKVLLNEVSKLPRIYTFYFRTNFISKVELREY
jgi:hypothetical protein